MWNGAPPCIFGDGAQAQDRFLLPGGCVALRGVEVQDLCTQHIVSMEPVNDESVLMRFAIIPVTPEEDEAWEQIDALTPQEMGLGMTLVANDGKVGCPEIVWDGPYSFRCGLGGEHGECARHGSFATHLESDEQETGLGSPESSSPRS